MVTRDLTEFAMKRLKVIAARDMVGTGFQYEIEWVAYSTTMILIKFFNHQPREVFLLSLLIEVGVCADPTEFWEIHNKSPRYPEGYTKLERDEYLFIREFIML